MLSALGLAAVFQFGPLVPFILHDQYLQWIVEPNRSLVAKHRLSYDYLSNLDATSLKKVRPVMHLAPGNPAKVEVLRDPRSRECYVKIRLIEKAWNELPGFRASVFPASEGFRAQRGRDGRLNLPDDWCLRRLPELLKSYLKKRNGGDWFRDAQQIARDHEIMLQIWLEELRLEPAGSDGWRLPKHRPAVTGAQAKLRKFRILELGRVQRIPWWRRAWFALSGVRVDAADVERVYKPYERKAENVEFLNRFREAAIREVEEVQSLCGKHFEELHLRGNKSKRPTASVVDGNDIPAAIGMKDSRPLSGSSNKLDRGRTPTPVLAVDSGEALRRPIDDFVAEGDRGQVMADRRLGIVSGDGDAEGSVRGGFNSGGRVEAGYKSQPATGPARGSGRPKDLGAEFGGRAVPRSPKRGVGSPSVRWRR